MSAKSSPDRRVVVADALIEIVARRGSDAVSVREVAAVAGVSIGAVQHYFSTKADMLAFAFEQVVARTRARLTSVTLSGSPPDDVERVLSELLPLDEQRRGEAAVNVAFGALAASNPALQSIQRDLLGGIRVELAAVLGSGSEVEAALLLAAVDGLALHLVSAPGGLEPEVAIAALRRAVAAALDRSAVGIVVTSQ